MLKLPPAHAPSVSIAGFTWNNNSRPRRVEVETFSVFLQSEDVSRETANSHVEYFVARLPGNAVILGNYSSNIRASRRQVDILVVSRGTVSWAQELQLDFFLFHVKQGTRILRRRVATIRVSRGTNDAGLLGTGRCFTWNTRFGFISRDN